MKQYLDDFIRGMNPLRDFEQITIYTVKREDGIEKMLSSQLKNIAQIVANIPKPILRGAAYGALVGMGGNLLNLFYEDETLRESIGAMTLLGAYIDLGIFSLRYLFRYTFNDFFKGK